MIGDGAAAIESSLHLFLTDSRHLFHRLWLSSSSLLNPSTVVSYLLSFFYLSLFWNTICHNNISFLLHSQNYVLNLAKPETDLNWC